MIENLKKLIKFIFRKRPIYTTAKIVQLSPNQLLQDRLALITGGSSGIGYAIAEAMLNAGANVCITGRNESKLEEAKKKLEAKFHKTVFYEVMDNSKISDLKEHLDSIFRKTRNLQLSILVNNAGTLGGVFGKATEAEFDQVLDTNLKGTFFLSQMVAHYMIDNGIHGNILNIGSSSCNRPAGSAYTLSKWGIKGLTRGMAKSLIPHQIVVNGLAPGPTATPMLIKEDTDNISLDSNPLGRYALPEEIANMAVFLTSNMGRTIIGDIIFMTGGAGVITYDDMEYKF